MDEAGTLAPMVTSSAWWRAQGRKFLVAVVVAAIAVMAIGWFTDLRQVMHGALVGIAVVAFFPLLLIGAALLLSLLAAVVLTVVGVFADGDIAAPIEGVVDAGGAVAEGGGWLLPRYYGFLAKRRHPAFWGGLCGLLLGGLLLWGMLALIIVPGETRTVAALAQAKARMEERYSTDGPWPRPDASVQLVIDGEPLRDGFGRPFHYELSGRWKLASWRLRSAGYDGVLSGDDLCVAGASRAVSLIESAKNLLRLVDRISTGEASTRDELVGVRAMSCAE